MLLSSNCSQHSFILIFIFYMKQNNIEIRPIFYDMYTHLHLINIKKHEPEIISDIYCGILLPSYPELTFDEQSYIISTLNRYFTI